MPALHRGRIGAAKCDTPAPRPRRACRPAVESRGETLPPLRRVHEAARASRYLESTKTSGDHISAATSGAMPWSSPRPQTNASRADRADASLPSMAWPPTVMLRVARSRSAQIRRAEGQRVRVDGGDPAVAVSRGTAVRDRYSAQPGAIPSSSAGSATARATCSRPTRNGSNRSPANQRGIFVRRSRENEIVTLRPSPTKPARSIAFFDAPLSAAQEQIGSQPAS